jgi:NAD-dependent DNA ligase
MMEKGFKTIDQIINADELDFILAFGKNGAKAYEGLMERLQNIYIHDLYGSTSFFGRGVGKRRFKKLFEEIKEADLFAGKVTVAQIVAVDGFEEKTAQKIIDGMPAYREWYGKVKDKVRIIEPKVTGLSMNGQKVVFTGFRDKGLEKEIEANGGQMQTGVSKNTTLVVAADPNSNSGKVKKATDLGIKVIGLEDLKQLL